MTTKGLRHIQMRENAIRECVQQGFVTIKHVNGKINLADIFTKEDKDVAHFLILRDHLMLLPPSAEKASRVVILVPPRTYDKNFALQVVSDPNSDIISTSSPGGVGRTTDRPRRELCSVE
eukprot:6790438-Ditylum_brightwellii.AAC.1